MRTALALARYQMRILFRTPGYWATALLLSTLGIIVFGLFLSDPTGPRIGVVDDAQNEASARLIDALERLDSSDVSVGGRDELLQDLRNGERWAVAVLPPGFGEAGADASVELWTGDRQNYATLTGAGIVRQVLAETAGGETGAGIRVVAEPVSADEPLRFIDVIVPGQVGLSLMFGNLFAAATLGGWRQQGILRRIAVSPARPVHMLASQILVFGLVSTMQATVLLAFSSLLFGVSIEGSPAALAVTVAAGIAAFLTLWYALTAVVRSPVTANAVASFLGFVMMFAGGSYLPVDDAPLFLKPVVVAAPLTYLNDALRAVVNDGDGLPEISGELAVLAAWTIGLFLVSMRAFRWTAND